MTTNGEYAREDMDWMAALDLDDAALLPELRVLDSATLGG